MTTKIVKSRDAATAVLRKIGVAQNDYTLFIEKRANGFEVFVDEATASVGGEVVEPAVKVAEAVSVKPKVDLYDGTPAKQDLYVARYQAHDYLVSIGIAEQDVAKYIKKTPNGYILIAAPEAVKAVKASKVAQSKAVKVKAEAIPKARAPKAPLSNEARIAKLTEGNSMSSFLRKCIVEGMTNQQAVEAAAKKFRWSPEQTKARQWYGAWFSHDCRRHGLIANVLVNGAEGRGNVRTA